MHRLRNFGAGPAKLPEEVYDILANELRDFENTGLSLLETSHRALAYETFHAQVQEVVRSLLEVPPNYKILFLQGGGQGQFAGVPLNLMSRTGTADYVVTGIWSKIAAREASKYGKINYVLPEQEQYDGILEEGTWQLDPNASYVHICANDTIHGIEFNFIPDTKGVPLVADMSSNIMTRKFDISKVIWSYLCLCPKDCTHVGTAGVTLVIVRDDLLGNALPICPSVLDWTLTAKYNSILNTPPVNAIQVMGRVLQIYTHQGGLDKMEVLATKKSFMVYQVIDQSNGFYSSTIAKKDRSKVNVPFRIGSPASEDLEKKFLRGAEALGMRQLNGHKLAGGIRVSLYNSVTLQDVEVLINYMNDFQEKHKISLIES